MPRSTVISSAPRRVALVTGAGRGIGQAIAIRLSREGFSVALTARSADQLEDTAAACSGPSMCVPADITDSGAAEDVFSAVERAWDPVEVLVANAGGGVSAPVVRTTDEDWQRMLDLNLTAPFRCIRRAIPSMVDRGAGRIVVIASVAAKIGEPYISAYTASKHGVLGLVRSCAAELARTGVTANAICPGYVDTPMTDATVAGIVERTGRTEAEARAILAAKQPSGRLIRPDEVVEAVWACVIDGSINGRGIDVIGGPEPV